MNTSVDKMTKKSDVEKSTLEKENSGCKHGCTSAFDHPIIFLVFGCLHFLVGVAAGSYFGGVVSTLEKQFQYDSTMSGIIGIISDASSFSIVLIVAYYGTKSNQPRIIGIGAIVSSLGYFCCAVPHFFNDLYQYQGTSGESQENEQFYLCNESFGNSSDGVMESTYKVQKSGGVGWIVVGYLLIGFGQSPAFPLTLTYLDDSTINPSTTSIYIATYMSMTSFGPLLGFFTSFRCLSLYVDFERVSPEDQPVGFRDPSWLGAWWLGYVIFSVAKLLLAIPMFFFPRHLTKYDCQICCKSDEKGKQGNMVGLSHRVFDKSSNLCEVFVGFFKAILRLVFNPVLACIFGQTSCDLAIVGGFIFFVAKYVQIQFDVSPATASIIVGLVTAPGNIFGNVVGSFFVKRLGLKLRGLSIMLTCICVSAALFAIPIIFIGCTNPSIAGVTVPYGGAEKLNKPAKFEKCNIDCSCSSGIYEPVCGADGVTYLSPCHAGCITYNDNTNLTDYKSFSECNCIDDSLLNVDNTATEGTCQFLCNKTLPFAFFVAVVAFFAATRTNPSIMTVLRCVDDEDRGLAMACQALVVRALGFLPASLYFGAVISSTCLLRQETESGEGACLIYDIEKYRYGFIGVFITLKVIGAVFACGVFFTVKYWKTPMDQKKLEKEQEEKPIAANEAETNA